jgi:hypothetical protein
MISKMLVKAMNTCTISSQMDTHPPEQHLGAAALEELGEPSICISHNRVKRLLATGRGPFLTDRFHVPLTKSLDLLVPGRYEYGVVAGGSVCLNILDGASHKGGCFG